LRKEEKKRTKENKKTIVSKTRSTENEHNNEEKMEIEKKQHQKKKQHTKKKFNAVVATSVSAIKPFVSVTRLENCDEMPPPLLAIKLLMRIAFSNKLEFCFIRINKRSFGTYQ